MPQIDDLATSVTELEGDELVQSIITRRNKRRKDTEEEDKLDRELGFDTGSDEKESSEDGGEQPDKVDQIVDNLSPEQAQAILDSVENG